MITKAIKDFRSSFITDLTNYGQATAVQNITMLALYEPLTQIITDLYREAGLTGARLQWSELRKEVAQKNAGFGRSEEWIKFVTDYLNFHAIRFVSAITDTMREDILKIIQEGIDNGWSIDRMVTALRETGLVVARARVIARTETIRAANVGHAAAANSLPFEVDKEWLAAADHRTRHSHRLINGNRVDEMATFEVPVYRGKLRTGTDRMQYPGDATASPSNTINCRCRALYKPKRDANGQLIPRSATSARIIPLTQAPNYRLPDTQIAALLKANATVTVEGQ